MLGVLLLIRETMAHPVANVNLLFGFACETVHIPKSLKKRKHTGVKRHLYVVSIYVYLESLRRNNSYISSS